MRNLTFRKKSIFYCLVFSVAVIEGCRTFTKTDETQKENQGEIGATSGWAAAQEGQTVGVDNSNRQLASFSFFSDPYFAKIQKIFDNRCVACHSCYNAPCQLQLVSYEGVMRGANKKNVHDFEMNDRQPTRLGIDAHSSVDWHSNKFDFYPVVEDSPDQSLLWNLVALRKENSSQPSQQKLLKVEESKMCPKSKEFSEYKEDYARGMPYGLPPLEQNDMDTLKDWILKGSLGPSTGAMQSLKKATVDLAPYENFLNQKDMKHRLVARYIYEHLFLAHIFFEEGKREYYRLIRAKDPVNLNNPNAEPFEIATRRPTDSAGDDFKYRFIRITTSITQKTHVTYKIDSERLERWEKLFFGTEWTAPEQFPSHVLWEALNPYQTFSSIPAKIRYQFLLDDTYYYVKTFILGPVCRGQVAVDSIDDHFWAFFLSPDKDPMLNEVPDFLRDNSDVLPTSGAFGNKVSLTYGESITEFRKRRALLYDELTRKSNFKFTKDMVWDGAGPRKSSNYPLLTIMRHFDSASVNKGGIGGIPKTIWMVDYHLLEELYYNLVVGYDVYAGNFHHVRSRIHMDGSRVNGQDLFLAFLPPKQRMDLRDYWHTQAPMLWWQKVGEITSKPDYSDLPWKNVRTSALSDAEIKESEDTRNNGKLAGLGLALRARDKLVSNWMSLINAGKGKAPDSELDCCSSAIGGPQTLDSMSDADIQLRKISRIESVHAGRFPDVVYIRVKRTLGKDLVYTMIVNKEHLNLDYMFNEASRRAYADDYLTFYRGFVSSYPNLFLEIPEVELPKFVSMVSTILKDQDDKSGAWKTFYSSSWIVSRFKTGFWETYDFFNQAFLDYDREDAGIIDLTRYLSR